MKKEALSICGITVEPGCEEFRKIKVSEMADGTPISVPVIMKNGVEPGPTLYLQACIHGGEVTGMEIARRATIDVDPNKLSGALVTVPIANVPAYLTRWHSFTLEERYALDMAQHLPGKADGFLTQRMAYFIFNEFVLKANYIVDFHSGGPGRLMYPFSYIQYDHFDVNGTLARREEITRALGTRYIMPTSVFLKLSHTTTRSPVSTWREQILKRGTITTAFEAGEAPKVAWEHVPFGVECVKNLMKHLKMLDGQPKYPEEQKIVRSIVAVRNDHGGILHTLAKPGQEVSKGDIIAEVNNAHETVEVIKCPLDSIVLMASTVAIVYPGSEVFWLIEV